MKSLKSRKDFSELRSAGKIFRPCSWLLISYTENASETGVRLGLTISASVAKAVTRNKLKRWCRDYFRLKENLDIDINLVFLKQKNPKFFKELNRDEIIKALDKFLQKSKHLK